MIRSSPFLYRFKVNTSYINIAIKISTFRWRPQSRGCWIDWIARSATSSTVHSNCVRRGNIFFFFIFLILYLLLYVLSTVIMTNKLYHICHSFSLSTYLKFCIKTLLIAYNAAGCTLIWSGLFRQSRHSIIISLFECRSTRRVCRYWRRLIVCVVEYQTLWLAATFRAIDIAPASRAGMSGCIFKRLTLL